MTGVYCVTCACSLRISTSIYPVPSICAEDQMTDWFDSLSECLHWNVRRQQKPLAKEASVESFSSATECNGALNGSDVAGPSKS